MVYNGDKSNKFSRKVKCLRNFAKSKIKKELTSLTQCDIVLRLGKGLFFMPFFRAQQKVTN